MKSLEIIDRKTMLYGDVILNAEEAEQIKQDLERLEKLERERELLEHDGLILVSTSVIDRIHKMQQDLEVLEIIRKILFNRYVISEFDGFDSTMENPIYYLELEDYDKEHPVFLLEQEEKDKLKQWLKKEEN